MMISKKLLTIACALSFSTLSTQVLGAQVIMEEEVYVHDPDKRFLPMLLANPDLVIDHVSSKGYEVYGSRLLPLLLEGSGIPYSQLAELSFFTHMDYPSYEAIQASMVEAQARYPHIMKLFSIGKSRDGRDLWVMKISDNVETDEIEPEFKYISSMHGDEITGRELMIRLIQHLGEAYSSGDKDIQWLVNNTEIFIMPSMNPDGSERRRRGNGRGLDLNRNFPELSTSETDPEAASEPEVQAIMKFQAERHFALSANFHGGAEVVNYPWDAVVERHPLDRHIYELSVEYAQKADYFYRSTEFPNGVTNGFDWYQVTGGMQDWSYRAHNDLQVTVELSDQKWPPYSMIDFYFEQNLPALIAYIHRVHQGSGFIIDEANTSGTVRVLSEMGEDLGTFPFHNSEFYKVLPAGTYRFEISTRNNPSTVKPLDVAVGDQN